MIGSYCEVDERSLAFLKSDHTVSIFHRFLRQAADWRQLSANVLTNNHRKFVLSGSFLMEKSFDKSGNFSGRDKDITNLCHVLSDELLRQAVEAHAELKKWTL